MLRTITYPDGKRKVVIENQHAVRVGSAYFAFNPEISESMLLLQKVLLYKPPVPYKMPGAKEI